ncbi:hypothetical protein CFOL_v3_20286 [Cephalotus follicularis]|uniref:Uncharacterized protein n=1 Tax=Cephalotus follicularis TaxID=3775 RepID=A0A1Q3C9Q6_CEPFO|nr:hypothetical protein CFOL_v3_20286 [Cephalotus follicularis]
MTYLDRGMLIDLYGRKYPCPKSNAKTIPTAFLFSRYHRLFSLQPTNCSLAIQPSSPRTTARVERRISPTTRSRASEFNINPTQRGTIERENGKIQKPHEHEHIRVASRSQEVHGQEASNQAKCKTDG